MEAPTRAYPGSADRDDDFSERSTSYGYLTIEASDQRVSERPAAPVEAQGERHDVLLPASVSEDGEAKSFSAELRVERNQIIFREVTIGLAVVGCVTAALALGYGASLPDEKSAARADAASVVVADARNEAPVPVGPPALPTVEGPVGQQAVEKAVAEVHPMLQHCYADGVERDPALAGMVMMKFLVAETGAVIGVADVGSSLPDRGVVHCVARSMKTLALRPAKARSLVTYPIAFPER